MGQPKLAPVPDPFPPSSPQASKKSLRAETQNISNSFEDLDAQVKSETGYSPEEATGQEETAQARRLSRAMALRPHLSTQKMYELKTKLRCACEGCPQGGAGHGAGLQVRAWGISDRPGPSPQTWWTRPSSAAAAGLTRSTKSACNASRSRSSTTCSACP